MTLPKGFVERPTKEEHGFEVCQMSLLSLQVCSKLPQDEIEARVNKYFHAGTSLGWHLETEGALAPVECSEGDGARHYLFSC